MKESIGGTQIFLIVVTLVLLFTGIMAFTINRSNAFAVKDQLVSIIESANGFDMSAEIVPGTSITDDTLEKVVEALNHNSYRQKGNCPSAVSGTEVASFQRNGSRTIGTNAASFCIVRVNAGNMAPGTASGYYYQIIVFYTLDLPVIKEIFNFKAVGETKALYS